MINILIIEDEYFIAEDIKSVISQKNRTIQIAYDYQQAIDSVKEHIPDLIISDINLGKQKTGIDAVTEIQKEHTVEAIFLTSYSDKKNLEQLTKIKEVQYLLKPFNEIQLSATVNITLNKIIKQKKKKEKINLHLLTKTELNILKLIGKGLTSREIALELYVSPKTIENHRSNIVLKLDIPSSQNNLLKWSLKNSEIINN